MAQDGSANESRATRGQLVPYHVRLLQFRTREPACTCWAVKITRARPLGGALGAFLTNSSTCMVSLTEPTREEFIVGSDNKARDAVKKRHFSLSQRI